MGGIHKGDQALARQGAQLLELVEMLAHFLRITVAKALPARGIVAELLSQRGTGCEIFHPLIYCRICPLYPARP
jgi:hypothetical protein